MTTTAVRQAQYRVLQALETAIDDLGPCFARPIEVTHSGAVPEVASETIDLRQRRRRLVPLRAVRHVEDYGGPRLPS